MKYLFFLALFMAFPQNKPQNTYRIKVTQDFKNYWFKGVAEVSSFELTQRRYGSLRKGKAVSIFVTEDFLKNEQVKTDFKSDKSTIVLKHNLLKNFVTGIYPYAIMNSTFTPLKTALPIKSTLSIQEWCGQSYTQLNHKENFLITSHTYFEGKSDREFTISPTYTEESIFNLIRLSPSKLPLGNIKIIPSLESYHLLKIQLQPNDAEGELQKKTDSTSQYSVNIPKLNRKWKVEFFTSAPYQIIGWEKVKVHDNKEILLEKATQLKTLQIPYWNLNKVGDEKYRNILKLN